MSIQNEISRLEAAKALIITAIKNKGVDVPDGVSIDVLPSYISQIVVGSSTREREDQVAFGLYSYGYETVEFAGYVEFSDGQSWTYGYVLPLVHDGSIVEVLSMTDDNDGGNYYGWYVHEGRVIIQGDFYDPDFNIDIIYTYTK